MSTPRVPLVQPGTRPELAEVEGRILAERGRVSLLYQVLLNSGPIASGWERMLTAVRWRCSTGPASSSTCMRRSPSARVSAPPRFRP